MHTQNEANLTFEKIVDLIGSKRDEITSVWFEALGEKWGESADHKLHLLRGEQEEKTELLSLLKGVLSDKFERKEQYITPILRKVRRTDYSIFDFFLEVSCLESAIENVLRSSVDANDADFLEGMRGVREELGDILGTILKVTSEIYEHIAESGGRAFCHLDTNGKILYANEKMHKILGLESVTEMTLESFFEDQERVFVRDTISGKLGKGAGIRRLQLQKDGGQSIAVGAEIAPIFINGENRGGYAGLVDLSLSEELNMRIFDHSPLGIVKVDTFEQLTYANHMALEIMGLTTWKSKCIRDIFPDDKNYTILKKQLEKRRKGFKDEYEAKITRISDGQKIPVKVVACPETDLMGNVVGSLAIVRSLLLDKTIEAIHKHIATIHNGQEILRAVAKETQKLIPNALFTVSAYTRGMTHVNQMFSHYPGGRMEWQVRWWKIPNYLAPWLAQEETIVIESVDALLNKDGWQELLDDPTVKMFLKEGFKSSIRYPVLAKDRVVASVALYGKKENEFNATHIDIMNKLPLHKAVLMAFYYNEVRDLRFRLDLINEISTGTNSIQDVVDVIVNRLAEHYQWEHIALFRVDEERREFSLMSEKPSSEMFRLSEDFKQGIDEGVLGYVYRKNEPVNIGNVNTDPKFKDIHKKNLINTVSELCLPIKTGEVFWVLNMEDSRQNAFSDKEQAALMDLIREVGNFLEKCWLYHFQEAFFLGASDAVIIANCKGEIKRVNPATLKLLGYESDDKLVGFSFKDRFKDKNLAEKMISNSMILSDEACLLGENESEVDVILSKSQTQKHFSDQVFFATDLSLQKRVLELENYWKMYNEIATQTKTPLSLAFGWLNRFKEEAEERAFPGLEYLDKSLRQLRKVELSYDRLALYDKKNEIKPHAVQFDLLQLLLNVKDEFPESEKVAINITHDKTEYDTIGDIFQISFSIRTILSYLLRFIPQREKISISLREIEGIMAVDISAYFPGFAERSDADIVHAKRMSELAKEMALGNELIKTFINENNGTFESSWVGDSVFFMIKLYKEQDRKNEH